MRRSNALISGSLITALVVATSLCCARAAEVSASPPAGRYELVEGVGIDVCEAYRRNLEPRHDAKPMACERQYNPAIPGFSSPSWRKLDLKKHFELYRKAEIYNQGIWPTGVSGKDLKEDLRHLPSRAKHLKAELYLARLDLNGDGYPRNILAIREEGCGPDADGSQTRNRLYALDAALTDIDYSRQKSWEGWDTNATIELYKGKPYVEAYEPYHDWDQLLTNSGVLHVMRELSPHEKGQDDDRGSHLRSVCDIRYTSSSEDSK